MWAVGISSTGGHVLGLRVLREPVGMSVRCLNIESKSRIGTSISAQWPTITGKGMLTECKCGVLKQRNSSAGGKGWPK